MRFPGSRIYQSQIGATQGVSNLLMANKQMYTFSTEECTSIFFQTPITAFCGRLGGRTGAVISFSRCGVLMLRGFKQVLPYRCFQNYCLKVSLSVKLDLSFSSLRTVPDLSAFTELQEELGPSLRILSACDNGMEIVNEQQASSVRRSKCELHERDWL
ncbi:hypothetical protein Pelo_5865 [Pelomyxa schiedti]|nr:hypothetical protein Pelo_5865 [Pelomyxa schiedti]